MNMVQKYNKWDFGGRRSRPTQTPTHQRNRSCVNQADNTLYLSPLPSWIVLTSRIQIMVVSNYANAWYGCQAQVNYLCGEEQRKKWRFFGGRILGGCFESQCGQISISILQLTMSTFQSIEVHSPSLPTKYWSEVMITTHLAMKNGKTKYHMNILVHI